MTLAPQFIPLEERPAETGEPQAAARPADLEPITSTAVPYLFTGRDRLTKGIRKRRSVPIIGYTGLNGDGKTQAMIRDALPSLAAGRPILSTVALLDHRTGEPHPLWTPLRSVWQLLDWRDGDILMDEITGIFDSRDGGMPGEIRRLMPQMRRRNVQIRWTGIDWDNTDRRLRQITQAVVMCRGYVPDHRAVRADGSRDALAMWAPKRAFSLVTYDAQTLSQSEDSKAITQEETRKRRARVLNREWYVASGILARRSYNTLDDVLGVDSSCTECGGRIMTRTCRGHDAVSLR